MFFLENFTCPEDDEFYNIFQEAVVDSENPFRTQIIDPIIDVLETTKGINAYVKYGDEFLEANAEMLAKEYPTTKASFPRKYVDSIFELFGFEQSVFKKTLVAILKEYKADTSFATITSTPSNVIHAIAMYYADMIMNRQLRDSAREQLGLTIYNTMFLKFFPAGNVSEPVMAYTYLNLDHSWNIVKSENMISWISMTMNSAFSFWRSKMSLSMNVGVMLDFLNRARSQFRQNIVLIADRYYKDIDEGNSVGSDVNNDEEYVESSSVNIKLRNNLIRKIRSNDQLYTEMSVLYTGIAKLKNVKAEDLFNFAKVIDTKDIGTIIDNILYVFTVKERNTIDDINSAKYINRITNFPTAVDRCIIGKPVILPLSKKYKTDQTIVKSYICLIATYIMYRINEVK